MTERLRIMSNLEGLTFDDWRMYHSDTEVQGIAIDALELLERTPEQKHGHWIRSPGFRPDFQCSACNGTYFGNARMFKFCPDCGARMDEEVSQDEQNSDIH